MDGFHFGAIAAASASKPSFAFPVKIRFRMSFSVFRTISIFGPTVNERPCMKKVAA